MVFLTHVLQLPTLHLDRDTELREGDLWSSLAGPEDDNLGQVWGGGDALHQLDEGGAPPLGRLGARDDDSEVAPGNLWQVVEGETQQVAAEI